MLILLTAGHVVVAKSSDARARKRCRSCSRARAKREKGANLTAMDQHRLGRVGASRSSKDSFTKGQRRGQGLGRRPEADRFRCNQPGLFSMGNATSARWWDTRNRDVRSLGKASKVNVTPVDCRDTLLGHAQSDFPRGKVRVDPRGDALHAGEPISQATVREKALQTR